jgi:hypothetical protein
MLDWSLSTSVAELDSLQDADETRDRPQPRGSMREEVARQEPTKHYDCVKMTIVRKLLDANNAANPEEEATGLRSMPTSQSTMHWRWSRPTLRALSHEKTDM